MSFMDGGKEPMKPDELRNLFIFFTLAALIYFTYDAFVLKPQAEALRQANLEKQQEQAEGVEAEIASILQGEEELLERSEVLEKDTSARVKIDNGEIFGSLSLKGGRLDDIAFHNYFETIEKENEAVLLSPRGAEHARYVDFGWIAQDKSISVPGNESVWQVVGNAALSKDNPVTLRWNNGRGLVFERRLRIDDNYLLTVSQKVTNRSGRAVSLHPFGLIGQTGIPSDYQGSWLMHEGPMGWINDALYEVGYKDMRKQKAEAVSAQEGWMGITDKYWLTAFIPAQGRKTDYNFQYAGDEKDKDNKGRYQLDYIGAPIEVASGLSVEHETQLYIGAKRVLMLEDYSEALGVEKLDLAVDFGWFWFMSKPFFYILHNFGLWFGNIGVAIIALTVLIRMLVFPLTNTSYKSFAKMKKVGPQVAELRKQHDKKEELQKELMALYQKEGVNPLAGCLPILIQIPIFFALYKTLYVTIEIRHAPFFGWIQDLSAPDPTSVFNLFGLIPWDPPGFLLIGVWPCVMLVAMLIQKKLNPPPQDQLQKDMMNYFPFIMVFVLGKFPSGLVIYWACSAWLGLIQQMVIMRRMGVPIYLFGETEDEKAIEKDLKDGGPAVHPLVEMAEDEVEHALFDGDDNEPPPPKKEISKPKPKKSKKKK